MTKYLPIRAKLLFSFSLFAGIAFFMLLSSIWYLEVKLEYTKITDDWDKVYRNIIAMEQEQKLFLAKELIHKTFFQSDISEYLVKQEKWRRTFIADLDLLMDQDRLGALGIPSITIEQQVNQIKIALEKYEADFDTFLRTHLRPNDHAKHLSIGNTTSANEPFLNIEELSSRQIFQSMDVMGNTITHQIESRTQRMLLIILFVGIFAFLLSIVLALFFAKKIMQPVLLLNDKIVTFTGSEFKMRIHNVEVESKDEVGVLTENFNLMASQLNKGISALNTKNKELTESNQQLASFASIVSHDLKSPLRTMSSFVSLMKRRMKDKLGESELEYMAFIQNGAQKMTELVNDLHEFSTVNAKGIIVEKVAFEPMLNEVLQLVDYQLKQTNAVVRIKSDLRVIKCDLIKIRQVFQNLIGNAMKYVAEDIHPEIKVTCAELAQVWQFSVSDNGIGIPEDYSQQIFQPFNRAGVGQEYEGTGLGLSICKKIVENHNGRIWVEPNPAGGTTFHFTISKLLPLTKQDISLNTKQ